LRRAAQRPALVAPAVDVSLQDEGVRRFDVDEPDIETEHLVERPALHLHLDNGRLD
jgi:hypothetical protein